MAGPPARQILERRRQPSISPSGLALRAEFAEPPRRHGDRQRRVQLRDLLGSGCREDHRGDICNKVSHHKRYVCQFAPHRLPAEAMSPPALPIGSARPKPEQGAAPGPPGTDRSTHPLPSLKQPQGEGLSRRDRNFTRIICRISYLTTVFLQFYNAKFCALVFFMQLIYLPSRNANFAACAASPSRR